MCLCFLILVAAIQHRKKTRESLKYFDMSTFSRTRLINYLLIQYFCSGRGCCEKVLTVCQTYEETTAVELPCIKSLLNFSLLNKPYFFIKVFQLHRSTEHFLFPPSSPPHRDPSRCISNISSNPKFSAYSHLQGMIIKGDRKAYIYYNKKICCTRTTVSSWDKTVTS